MATHTYDPTVESASSILSASDLDPWQTVLADIEVRFGAGRMRELGEIAAAFGRSVLLVTDPGLVSSGAATAARASLAAAGMDVRVFDQVAPNPTTEQIEAGAGVARTESVEVLVAIGGGSVMDCAKGINFLASNGGRMEDYWGFGKASRSMLPSIAVPTTAGTGSEAQSYALVTQPGTHRKMACGDHKARFRTIVLDPELIASAPVAVAGAAGMDALSHALESHVTTARTTGSALLSRRAFELLEPTLEEMAHPAPDLAARGRMMLGAHLAGAAISASMLGAAHAAANPLTAHHGVLHGQAVGLMLPAVLRFNGAVADDLYRELWPAGADALAQRIEDIRRTLHLPTRLSASGVTVADLPHLARAAGDEWTGAFNPRPVDHSAFEELYAAAL